MKLYQVKKTINGTEFIAQYNGLRAALQMQDSTNMDGSGITSNEKLTDYILKNVIVSPPNLTPDDDVFPDMHTLNEVVIWGTGVANGKFPEDAVSVGAKDTGK